MPRSKRPPTPVVPSPVDPVIAHYIRQRRTLLRQLQEVIRRVGPSTPNREAVNADRAQRRQALRDAIHATEWQIVVRANELVPPEYTLPAER